MPSSRTVSRLGGLATLACLGLLAACPGSPPTRPSATAQSVTGSAATAGAAASAGPGPASQLPGGARAASGDGVLIAQRTIHFDFDSAGITPAYAGMISAHGRSLALDERLRVRLEGNTDERGSPQYNVGSGARRAQAVRRALRLQGAREIEVATVSYGAERPVVEGHDESARAQNRRVDVVYPANR